MKKIVVALLIGLWILPAWSESYPESTRTNIINSCKQSCTRTPHSSSTFCSHYCPCYASELSKLVPHKKLAAFEAEANKKHTFQPDVMGKITQAGTVCTQKNRAYLSTKKSTVRNLKPAAIRA